MAKNAVTDWDVTAANNTDVGGINIAENCPAAGINNALREMMKQIATWLSALFASAANLLAGTAANKALTPASFKNALAFQTLTASGGTFTPDMANGVNFTITLTAASSTLANIANAVEGYGGLIEIIQDATGGRALVKPSSGSKYYGPSGFPSIAGAPNAITSFAYVVRSSSVIYLWPAQSMAAA